MPIDSTKIQNPILKRIAEGDLSVVNDINEYSANITEYIYANGEFNPLTIAVRNGQTAIVKRLLDKKEDGSYEFPAVIQNIAALRNSALREAAHDGHIEVVNMLLAKNDDGSYEFPGVIQNITTYNNYALCIAAENGHIEVVNRLLAKNDDGTYEFLSVIQNITAFDNCSLRFAAQNGHIEVVKKLLAKNDDGSYEFPDVIHNIAARDNYALRLAAEHGHDEISYILATAQWPNGACDMPKEARRYLPSIQNGARIVDGRNDALQVLRCLQQGSSRVSIYSPSYSAGKNIPFDIVNNIADLSGIYGKVKLVKGDFGIVVEDNTTPMERKYRELAMKRRSASIP